MPSTNQLDGGHYQLWGGENQDELIVFIEVPSSGDEDWHVYEKNLDYLTDTQYALKLERDDSATYGNDADFTLKTPKDVTWGDTPGTPPNYTYTSGDRPFAGSGKAMVFDASSTTIDKVHWYAPTESFTLSNGTYLILEPVSDTSTAPAKKATSTMS